MKKNTIGILGGGQLCQMLAEYLTKNNKIVYFIDPSDSPPASHTLAKHIKKAYDDTVALDELINKCNVITYEFENIPLETLEYLEKKIEILPSKFVLSISQNRLNEKRNFIKCGIRTPKFVPYNNKIDLEEQLISAKINLPVIIKTNRLGYDGKGQFRVNNKNEINHLMNQLDENIDYIVEEKISFKKEISIVIGRNKEKEIFFFDPIENIHKNGILDTSIFPARIDESTKNKAIDLSKRFVKEIDLIGIIAIEMFIDEDNEILFNEIAPRPHNSGHLTRESHLLSQFGLLGKIICDEKLENPEPINTALMKNILGEFFLKKDHEKIISKLKSSSNYFIKLYNKDEAKIGRKMGHITVITNDIENTIIKINQLID
ncbi:MAG: 5-(carboxyamino)imidazole ribonucleotide synthase [Chloroflexi bacterium]|nr:5-(carboxyamino)imidazole ribonucleotide synthase [Chloroflexota bacterium]|tara:strand:- start:1937 stop:3061 length:1125 start_codon:yes stop_codon:yes gene_type:complete